MTVPILALQDLDVAIDDLRRRLGVLPERAAAHDLNERRRAAEAAIVDLGAQMEKLAEEESAVEASLGTTEARIKALDDALRSPGSATRDAQAIIHEIDQLKVKAEGMEEAGLALLEQRDALLAQENEHRAELERIAAEAPTVLSALTAAEGEGGQELADLEAQRVALVGEIAADTVATYDRLRAKFGGVAVARVESGACTGCHLALPAADLDQFNRLAAGAQSTCDQCGRLLIRE